MLRRLVEFGDGRWGEGRDGYIVGESEKQAGLAGLGGSCFNIGSKNRRPNLRPELESERLWLDAMDEVTDALKRSA